MSTCKDFKKHMIDLVEQKLGAREREKLEQHCSRCTSCREEYHALKRLYELLDTDEVVLPEHGFFDRARRRVRERELPQRGGLVRKIAYALVPAALVAAVVLLVFKPEPTVDISIPTAALLEDRDVAAVSLSGVVSEELVRELSIAEESFAPGLYEMIDELNEQEKDRFVEELVALYDNGT